MSIHRASLSETQAESRKIVYIIYIYKIISAEQKVITPSTCLFSSERHLQANSAQCSPGARTCLGGLILLPLALILVVDSLGFTGISHYLPYCERSSNTEEVFSFPVELFLGHSLASRQNYQSLLPKALFSGLEILRC